MGKTVETWEGNRRSFVKECLKEYYDEDKKILIDSSICRVFCTKYVIGNLIYFGNKILITEDSFAKLEKFASYSSRSKWEEIRKENAKAILKKAETNANNFRIISFPEAENKVDKIAKYLQENPDVLLYMQDERIYQSLTKIGFMQQLYLMKEGMKEVGLFKTKYKFETIGVIRFENCKMKIYKDPIRKSEIKVFDSQGRERKGEVVEVKQNDFIKIKSYKEDGVKSVKLYEIVSKHSRHHASLILWTNLKAHETSNWYIEQLPYLLQQIIIK